MEIYLDNELTDLSLFTFNDGLNFGRFLKELDVKTYTLKMNKAKFFSLVEPNYNIALAEIKADDEKYNETSDFTDANYCSLEDLLPKSEVLTEIVDTYLHHEIFADLAHSKEFKYVINSIEKIHLDGDYIFINGKCFLRTGISK